MLEVSVERVNAIVSVLRRRRRVYWQDLTWTGAQQINILRPIHLNGTLGTQPTQMRQATRSIWLGNIAQGRSPSRNKFESHKGSQVPSSPQILAPRAFSANGGVGASRELIRTDSTSWLFWLDDMHGCTLGVWQP